MKYEEVIEKVKILLETYAEGDKDVDVFIYSYKDGNISIVCVGCPACAAAGIAEWYVRRKPQHLDGETNGSIH